MVLVTGATGFVGQHLVRHLQARGYAIRVLVRNPERLGRIAGLFDEYHEGDLTDPASLEGAADGVVAVLHAACAVAGTFDSSEGAVASFLQVNRDGTEALAHEVLRHPGLRLVHVSSTAAMGPQTGTHVDESAPCNPRTPYQRSKYEAEQVLLRLHREADLNVVLIRPCVVAGRGKDKSELLTLLRWTRLGPIPLPAGAESLTKPMIWIDDLCQALLAGIDRGQPGGIYLVHSDGGHTLGGILDAAARVWGRERGWMPIPAAPFRAAATLFEAVQKRIPSFNPPLTHDRLRLLTQDRHLDISRARRELGWQPTTTDAFYMLRETWQGYRDAGVL
jgi:nucleoside-diphosphate-sugar epimerase